MNPDSTQHSTNTTGTGSSADTNIREIEWIVEQFRDRNLTKSRAVQSITAWLNFNLTGEETEKFSALNQYLTTLDLYEKLSVEATQHGTRVAGFTGDRDAETQQGGQSADSGVHETQTWPSGDSRDEMSTFLNSLEAKESLKRLKHQVQQILKLNCTWKVKGKQILHHFRVSTQVFYTNEIV